MENIVQPLFPDELIDRVAEWLEYDGAAFFQMCCDEYGSPDSACWLDGTLPHSVHFREGMQVRNFMRSTGLCEDWDAHQFDNNWGSVVMVAVAKCWSD